MRVSRAAMLFSLSEVDDDDLIDELEDRGYVVRSYYDMVGETEEIFDEPDFDLLQIYYLRQNKQSDDALKLLDQYIYNKIGRIVTV
jgi:hypothetical protein